jgi:hypothetical protein
VTRQRDRGTESALLDLQHTRTHASPAVVTGALAGVYCHAAVHFLTALRVLLASVCVCVCACASHVCLHSALRIGRTLVEEQLKLAETGANPSPAPPLAAAAPAAAAGETTTLIADQADVEAPNDQVEESTPPVSVSRRLLVTPVAKSTAEQPQPEPEPEPEPAVDDF